jgi:hypothetical protein
VGLAFFLAGEKLAKWSVYQFGINQIMGKDKRQLFIFNQILLQRKIIRQETLPVFD